MWETFVCTTLGLEVPVLASLPRRNQRAPALCGCKKHGMDLFGDHTSTCTAHSGATKAHDWAVGVLGPLFRTAGHTVRSQHQVTASAGQRRGDVEIKSYLQDVAGHCSLVFDLSITHDRIGSSGHVQQNGLLSHPQDLDAPLRLAVERKAHRETTAHFIATGLPSQQNRSDNAFTFKRAAFYMGLKSKVGLVAAKASAFRINLNIQGCSIVAPPLHAPSRAPLLLPLLLSHNLPFPRVR